MKSMQELRNAEAEEIANQYAIPLIRSMYPSLSRGEMARLFKEVFQAGWDARDKIDNEALKVAVEELSLISIQKTKAEYEYDEDDLWDFVCASEAYEIAILKARKALDKICELRGI